MEILKNIKYKGNNIPLLINEATDVNLKTATIFLPNFPLYKQDLNDFSKIRWNSPFKWNSQLTNGEMYSRFAYFTTSLNNNESFTNLALDNFIEEFNLIVNYLRTNYEIEKFNLLAHSLSALVAYEFAEKKPELVNKILYLAPVFWNCGSHILQRSKPGRVFYFDFGDKIDDTLNDHFYPFKDLFNMNEDNFIHKEFMGDTYLILGKYDSGDINDVSRTFANNNNSQLFIIEESGRLPWMPEDYIKRDISTDSQLAIWNDIKDVTINTFWSIIDDIISNK